MKKLNTLFIILLSLIIVINIGISALPLVKPGLRNDSSGKIIQLQKVDSSNVLLAIPSLKCGQVSWKTSTVTEWLKKYCEDNCNNQLPSGYKFSGEIKNADKSWSLKVTIKTDKEYAQPVKFYPESGKFDGKVYFDKANRMETQIKIMLRDSNNFVLTTYAITLTE